MEIEKTVRERQMMVLELMKFFDDICLKNCIQYTLVAGSILGAIRHKGFIPWDTDMDVLVPVDQIDLLRNKLLDDISINDKYALHIWDKEKNYSEVVDRLCFKDIPHQQIHLDIFPLIGAPDTRKKQKRFVKLCFYSYRLFRCKHCNTRYSRKDHKLIINIIKPFLYIIPDKFIIFWYHKLQNKYSFSNSKFAYILASSYGMREMLEKTSYLDTLYVPFEDTKFRIPKKAKEYLISVYGEDYMTPKKEGYKIVDNLHEL